MKANPAQMFNRSQACGRTGWCPICSQPMDWFDTGNEGWSVCDGCRVAFSPGWAFGLGASSEGWQAQVHKLYEYRWLTDEEYYGPYADMDYEETGPFSA
jgi:hypothetical protein